MERWQAAQKLISKPFSALFWFALFLIPLIVPMERGYELIDSRGPVGVKFVRESVPLTPLFAGSELKFNVNIPDNSNDYSSFAVPIGTYARTNKCNLEMHLAPNLISKPIGCSTLVDNSPAQFDFGNRLLPGTYHGTLVSTAADSSHAVAPYVAVDAQGAVWLQPLIARSATNGISLMIPWLLSGDLNRLILIPCLILAVLVGIYAAGGQLAWILLIATYIGGVTALTKKFSGHDETAHVHMFFSAMLGELKVEPPDAKKMTLEFFDRAEHLKEREGFYRLHAAKVVSAGQCPHAFAGSCGASAEPIWLYKHYAKISPPNPSLVSDPDYLISVQQAIHLVLTSGLILLALIALDRRSFAVFSALFIFCGFAIANFPAITNDFPLEILGFFGFIACTRLFQVSPSRHLWLFPAAYSALAIGFGRHIDKAWLSSIPFISFLWLILGVRYIRRRGWINKKHLDFSIFDRFLPNRMWTPILLHLGVFAASLAYLYIFGKPTLRFFLELIQPSAIPTRERPGKLPLDLYLPVVWHHFRSVVGSFVWGHAYFGWEAYAVFLVIAVLAYNSGIYYLWTKRKDACGRIAVIVAGFIMASYVYGIFWIAGNWLGTRATLDATSKIRFMAPGIGVGMAIAGLGILEWLRKIELDRYMICAAAIWIVIVLTYYLPKFFLLPML
jgi:hypothetical protein